MPRPYQTEENQYVTEADKFMDWGSRNIWGTPEPRWYDDMSVDDMTPEMKQQLLRYEAENPYDRRPPMIQWIDTAGKGIGSAMEGVGAMFRGKPRETFGGPLMAEAIDAGRRLDDQARAKRLNAEIALIDLLMRDLMPEPRQSVPMPDSTPPPGFGSQTMPQYPDLMAQGVNDPEVQRLMEERRFQQMMEMRGRPLTPPTE